MQDKEMTGNGDKVCCVIAAHNGEVTIAETLRSLEHQTVPPGRILLIDNDSIDNTLEIAESLGLENLRVVRNERNLGVGAVFNAGLRLAGAGDFKHLWVVDQDTCCGPACLETLLEAESVLKKENPAALFSLARSKPYPEIVLPPYIWRGKRFEEIPLPPDRAACRVDSSISSGTLYNVDALQKIHGFREDYFIDFVDHECHMRLVDAGYGNFWVPGAEIFHELGYPVRESGGGVLFVHPAWRYYYMSRNMVNGYWHLGGTRALFAFLKEADGLLGRFAAAGLDTGTIRRFLYKGFCDAIIGRFGAIDNGKMD